MNTTKLTTMTVATATIALLAQLQLPAKTLQTVDDFQYTAGKHAWAFGMCADGQGNLYAAGGGADAANVCHGLVLRSSDQGATWLPLADYVYQSGANTSFASIGADQAGNIYALGQHNWTVGRSSEQGASWSVIDVFNYGTGSLAYGFIADSQGDLFVSGSGTDPATGSR